MKFKKKVKKSGKILLGTALVGGAALAALSLWNKSVTRNVEPLQSMLPGQSQEYTWPDDSLEGAVFYKVLGPPDGPPLVLLHDTALGASGYSWRWNLADLSKTYRCYVPDLPGYGLSAKPNIHYTGRVGVQFVLDFLRDVVGRPCAVVAEGGAGAYAVAAASAEPRWFNQLILLHPTDGRPATRSASYLPLNGGKTLGNLVYNVLRTTSLGPGLYNLVSGRDTLKANLEQQIYHNRSLSTTDRLNYYHTAAHQPGSTKIAASLFTGKLSLSGVLDDFARLTIPVTLVWGREARGAVGLDSAIPWLERNPRADLVSIPLAALAPQEEQFAQFNELIDRKLGG